MTRPHAIWLVAAIGVSGVIAMIFFSIAREPDRTIAIANTIVPNAAPEDLGESWCASELEPIAHGACLAMPRDSKSGALLVYLHGRYSPDSVAEEHDRQSRVAKLGTARGFAVLAMHGKQGECTSPEYASSWCWPSNEKNMEDGAAFIAPIAHAIAVARKSHPAQLGTGSNVLLGFSNGAYFAALIATRALAPFDAIVIAHGGPVEPTSAMGASPPLLLITADDDASDPEMRRLESELASVHWPHVMTAREGGHALPDWDIDVALQFFMRVRTESLPLVPALPNRSRQ